MNKPNLYILSYDFGDFLKKLQGAFEEGYRLDYSTTATYPFTTMGQYMVSLPHKDNKKQEPTVVIPPKPSEPVKELSAEPVSVEDKVEQPVAKAKKTKAV